LAVLCVSGNGEQEATQAMTVAQTRGGWWRGWWMARIEPPAPSAGRQDGTGTTSTEVPSTEIDGFEPFVRHYERQVLTYLWRMVGNDEAAFDLCQEVFVRAWQHFATVRGYERPLGWLLRVATNLALNYRQRRSAPVGAALTLDETNDPGHSDPAGRIAEHDLVRGLLAQLAPRRRAALLLREVYGFSCQEIAATLGMTPDAVKMALSRARAQFRTLYRREEGQR
jgi:RNA polymerase sigma-70 factor (ECF subfamily)